MGRCTSRPKNSWRQRHTTCLCHVYTPHPHAAHVCRSPFRYAPSGAAVSPATGSVSPAQPLTSSRALCLPVMYAAPATSSSSSSSSSRDCTGKAEGAAGRAGHTSSVAQHVSCEQHAGRAEGRPSLLTCHTERNGGRALAECAPAAQPAASKRRSGGGGGGGGGGGSWPAGPGPLSTASAHFSSHRGRSWRASKCTYPGLAGSSNMALPGLWTFIASTVDFHCQRPAPQRRSRAHSRHLCCLWRALVHVACCMMGGNAGACAPRGAPAPQPSRFFPCMRLRSSSPCRASRPALPPGVLDSPSSHFTPLVPARCAQLRTDGYQHLPGFRRRDGATAPSLPRRCVQPRAQQRRQAVCILLVYSLLASPAIPRWPPLPL